MSGAAAEETKKTKRELLEAERKQKVQEQAERLQNVDVTKIAEQELSSIDEGGRINKKAFGYQENNEEEDSDGGPLVSLIRGILSLFQSPPRPPLPWKTYRREEIESYLDQKMSSPLWGILVPSKSFWYWMKSNKKVHYYGDFDKIDSTLRNGRGVCTWPDPSRGGGESYYGLWRANQPHEYGVFRWFDGDIYQGQWVEGEMQGYGTYWYSQHGAHPGDRYEGGYYKANRQGTGVYRYTSKGGVYLGEWLHGKMQGHGLMLYPDGECYIGSWIKDKKDGLGIYVWGQNAGESVGDKYEGQFKDGLAHGLGRTLFGTGGWHKGYYARGKMNGYGVMQTAEGWEYYGAWRDDELHHDIVCFYLYANVKKPTVQRYNMGVLTGERAYDPASSDWTETESAARSAIAAAEEIAIAALSQKEHVAKFVRRAKQSQQLAKDAEEEARYYAKAALKYKEYLRAWYGLKPYLTVE